MLNAENYRLATNDGASFHRAIRVRRVNFGRKNTQRDRARMVRTTHPYLFQFSDIQRAPFAHINHPGERVTPARRRKNKECALRRTAESDAES